ncbi:hypothetical protein HDV01_004294, partial [Terramyces sp. JEL0728]
MKILFCVKEHAGTGKSFAKSLTALSAGRRTADKKEDEAPNDKSNCTVLMRKPGLFSEAKSRIIHAEAPDFVTFSRLSKLTLEDETATKRGKGEFWRMATIKVFKVEALSKVSRRFFIDDEI